jgi:hypothetical protein
MICKNKYILIFRVDVKINNLWMEKLEINLMDDTYSGAWVSKTVNFFQAGGGNMRVNLSGRQA